MAEEQTVIAATDAEPAAELPGIAIDLASDGKAEIRTKVWDYLAAHKLASFPWPPHKRIPNFKGAEEAGDRVLKMDAFVDAKVLKVDPDKPLQQVRIHALDESKSLLVPTPRLRYGFLNKITPPADSDKRMIRTCATRQGFAEYSSPVGLEDKVNVDLVVVGSVAVSTKGWRVGKGEGFSDLEYAIMASMGAVNAKTPVVAVVHDCQVIDLPEGIFGRHDVAVDYIVTPTRVIACEGRPARPAGIIWGLLNAERLESIPILRKLRYRDWKAGVDVKIAGETEAPTELVDEEVKMEDTEERRSKPRSFRRNVNRRRPRRSDDGAAGDEHDAAGDGGDNRRRDGGDDDGGD
jgi:5-formyltetrahydrofolate cyclo-ligase